MLIEFTPEEQGHIKEVQEAFLPELEQLAGMIRNTADTDARRELIIRQQAIYDSMIDQLDTYSDKCQRKRFEKIARGGMAAVVEHAKEQAPVILEYMHRDIVKEFEGAAADDFITELGIGIIKKGKIYIYADYATHWLKDELRLHIDYAREKDGLQALLEVLIEAIESSPFTCGEKGGLPHDPDTLAFKHKPLSITPESVIYRPNMPMYHGKATDTLAALTYKNLTENPIANKAVLQTEAGDYKIVINNFDKVKGSLGVNAHKLLSVGIAEFTQINNYGGGGAIPKIIIPFDEYARKLGYKIDEQETDGPEAAAKEKKRAQEAKKKAKARIKQDLELLGAMKWTWQENIKGKSADFDSISVLDRVAIRKGYIIMEFGRNMAEYLKQLPLTQYPQGLLAIDARSDNAYKIGLKMTEYYNMDNNQIKGTSNRLKVSTLLAVTNLPTIEDLQKERPDDSRHWDRRIKEPFEKALDALTGKVIISWEYVKPKGEPLTEAEAYNIADYETFAGILVQFEPLDPPEHKERLARRAEEKKAAAAKKAAKGKQEKPAK